MIAPTTVKRLVQNLFGRHPDLEPLSYEAIKDQKHIFVFGVWGRTATTALQRIMNSTRGICIWGEPGNFLVDNMMDAYLQLCSRMESPDVQARMQAMPDAYSKGDFSRVVAMANSDWTRSRRQVEQAFVNLFLPVIPLQRIGFKEIRLRSRGTLEGLRRMFPNCQFVHMFRDPLTQWPSVQAGLWPELRSIEHFLSRVEELGNLYLEFDGVFVQDTQLRSRSHLDRLTKHLGLAHYEESLVGDGVFAAKAKPPLTPVEARMIEERLGSLFQRLQGRSTDFFGKIG